MRYRFLRFPGGLAKAVTLSYDDGCKDDIRFSETICAHGLKCTFNINSGFIAEKEGDWHLTREQIKKYLIDTGNEIFYTYPVYFVIDAQVIGVYTVMPISNDAVYHGFYPVI